MNVLRTLRKLPVGLAALALLSAAACSSDSPSEPNRQPGTPPGTGGGGSTYNVTVTVNPASIPAGSSDPVLVTVRAVRADNGQPAANGTAVVFSVSAGTLQSLTGPTSVAGTLTNGNASIQYFAPTDTIAAVTIQASVAGSVGQATVQIEEADTFFVSFVEPNFGSPQGGDDVTIHGSGFEPPARVLFGNANAQVLSVNPNTIRVRTPPSSAGGNVRSVVNVGVTINVNEAEEASDSVAGAFTYTPGGTNPDIPVVLSVTPATGPNEGGTQVSIQGEGFSDPLQVEFGSEGTFLEAEILSVSSNRIEARTPAATGFGQALRDSSVSVRVRNLDSGLFGTLGNAFRYGTEVQITSISPGSGAYTGGDLVTIFGQGFDAPVAVEMGGEAQSIVSVTGTEIVIRTVPITTTSCSDQSGPTSEVNVGTGGGADNGPVFTYIVEALSPLALGVNPNNGPEAGNTLVTITGSNLFDALVTFNGRPATLVSSAADGSQVQVRTPFLPRDQFTTEACDDNDDGAQGERFIPTAVDVTVENLATTCTYTFPDGYAYNPSDTSCRNDTGEAPAATECSDGIDNDGDMMIDLADPECDNAADDDESA